jgi:hypothetical protein
VSVDRTTLVALLVAVTGTLGTAAPLGSLTSPVISPRVWAGDIPAVVSRRQPSMKTRAFVMDFITRISIVPPRFTSALAVDRRNGMRVRISPLQPPYPGIGYLICGQMDFFDAVLLFSQRKCVILSVGNQQDIEYE